MSVIKDDRDAPLDGCESVYFVRFLANIRDEIETGDSATGDEPDEPWRWMFRSKYPRSKSISPEYQAQMNRRVLFSEVVKLIDENKNLANQIREKAGLKNIDEIMGDVEEILDMVYERKDSGLTDEDWRELYKRTNDEDEDDGIDKI